MKYGTSLRVRHLMGRLDKGEEFVEAIRKLCKRERIRAGQFEAIGVFASAELQQFEPRQKQWTTFFSAETPLEVASLSGNVSTLGKEIIVNASGVFSYSSHKQAHVVAGHLSSAKVLICEFHLTAFEDISLERTYDSNTGLPLWNKVEGSDIGDFVEEPQPKSSPAADKSDDDSGDGLEASGVHVAKESAPPQVIRRGRKAPEPEPEDAEEKADADQEGKDEPAKAAGSEPDSSGDKTRPAPQKDWQAAIKKAKAAEAKNRLKIPEGKSADSSPLVADLDYGDEHLLKAGDTLEHPTLGSCKVVEVQDEEWARIKMGAGKVRKLALHLFDVVHVSEEDGHDVFELKKRKTR